MVLVFLLLLVVPVAFSEENYFESMSIDDLLALRQSIDSEISARLASDVSTIYPGVYYVGKDIKEGSFVIITQHPNSRNPCFK